MGRVWSARDELLGRDVALKELVLPRGLPRAEVDELRERVIREARAIAQIDHRNVVRVFDVIHHEDTPWIVMELVASRSLYDLVHEDGPMAPDRAAQIGLEVLAGLRAAHAAGVLHRDVKPANVLLAHDGRVVLTDFGLASTAGESAITSTGVVLGSPSYLAPERALDEGISAAADLWSLGATLYAAVEGQAPYDKSSPVATLAALATQPPRPPKRAGVLRPVLDGLLRKDPAQRVDADAAERLLRAAADGFPAPTPIPGASAFPAPILAATSLPAPPPIPRFTPLPTPPSVPTSAFPQKGRKPQRVRWWLAAAGVLMVAAGIAVRPMLTTAGASEVPQAGPTVGTQQPDDEGGTPTKPGAPLPPTTAGHTPVPTRPVATGRPTTAAPGKPAPGTTTTTTRPAAGATTKATTPAPPPAVGHAMENMQTGACLTLVGSSIVLWGCDGRDAQKFDFRADDTMRVLGKCAQLQGSGDGARIGVAACSGSAAQRWNYNTSFDLVNLMVVKCADVPDSSTANGVAAQVWECSGNGNQKWRY